MVLQLERNGEQRLSLLTPEFGDRSNHPLPELPKAWVGIEVQPFTGSLAKEIGLPSAGFRIARIYPGSPLGGAGAEVGDLLVALDGQPLKPANDTSSDAFEQRVHDLAIDSRARFSALRDGKPKQFAITVQASPAETSGLRTLAVTRLRAQLRELGFYDRVALKLAMDSQGVFIDGVEGGGAAGLAHLRRGDVITRLGDAQVEHADRSLAGARRGVGHPGNRHDSAAGDSRQPDPHPVSRTLLAQGRCPGVPMNKSVAAGLLAVAFALLPPQALGQVRDYRPIYRSLIAKHAAAVVTVKFVMAVTTSGKEERVEDRTQALLVSPDGLLLVPDRAVSVDFRQLMGTSQGSAPVAKSSEFRVRLADSDDWLPADLVTRDTQLGLAWLRLRNPPAGLSYVNLDDSVLAEPGMTFFSLLRTSDEWGGVPVFHPGFIMGETHTPKSLLLVDGMPGVAFSAEGQPMGYVDIDLGRMIRSRGAASGMGLDMADSVLQMTPISKVAAATHLAQKLPSMVQGK